MGWRTGGVRVWARDGVVKMRQEEEIDLEGTIGEGVDDSGSKVVRVLIWTLTETNGRQSVLPAGSVSSGRRQDGEAKGRSERYREGERPRVCCALPFMWSPANIVQMGLILLFFGKVLYIT